MFGLVIDGMNCYGSLSTQHSSWPILLVIYNLPPWLLQDVRKKAQTIQKQNIAPRMLS